MADQDQPAARRDILAALHVHFRDERAGGVEHVDARFRVALDRLGDTVRAEDRDSAVGHLVEFLNESAFITQILDDMPVMHDLMTHIDRRTVLLQRAIDDLDRTDNPAQKPRAGQG